MLENTAYRLKNGTGLTVVYFGGSITEGAGASAYENCWAGKTSEWLSKAFPSCPLNHVSAAIGGTGSTLGVYRCDRDVLAAKPDLVFYEFAVNDSSTDFKTVLRNTEGCFRKIWRANPFCDIVTVYTAVKGFSDAEAQGGVVASKTAIGAASRHYGVPEIDIGQALMHRILLEGGGRDDDAAWLRYTTDLVHPNDGGYAICAEIIKNRLLNMIDAAGDPEGLVAHRIPDALIPESLDAQDAKLVDVCEAVHDGSWHMVEKSLCGRYPHYLECMEPGGELRLTFYGSELGVYWMMARDSGDAVFSMDGGSEKAVSSWDSYCAMFDRANEAVVFSGLEKGKHELLVRVSEKKNEGSQGHAVRIGAFMVM